MTDEERDSAWYTNEDMILMKNDANVLARQLRSVSGRRISPDRSLSEGNSTASEKCSLKRLDEEYPTNFPPQSSAAAIFEERANEAVRGLELRIFLGRQLKKYIAGRTIMEYQRRNNLKIALAAKNGDPNLRLLMEIASKKLGYVSAKCSRWARDMALATGQSDFQAVYESVNDSFSTLCFKEDKELSLARKRVKELSETVAHKKMMLLVPVQS